MARKWLKTSPAGTRQTEWLVKPVVVILFLVSTFCAAKSDVVRSRGVKGHLHNSSNSLKWRNGAFLNEILLVGYNLSGRVGNSWIHPVGWYVPKHAT